MTAPVIKYRLGNIKTETIKSGRIRTINDVKFSFYPAGHILGFAQIRVEHKGVIWVPFGDYKLELSYVFQGCSVGEKINQ